MWWPFGKKEEKSTKPDTDPYSAHPKRRQGAAKKITFIKKTADNQNTPANKEQQMKAAGISPEDLEEIRKAKLKKLGIPYDKIAKAEELGKLAINPDDLELKTNNLNTDLERHCFNFRISFFECLIFQFLQYDQANRIKDALNQGKTPPPPPLSLLNIAVLYEAEKRIRKKFGLSDEAPVPENHSKPLYDQLWSEAEKKMVWQQAEKRIRHEKKLPPETPIPREEIIEKIKQIKEDQEKRTSSLPQKTNFTKS